MSLQPADAPFGDAGVEARLARAAEAILAGGVICLQRAGGGGNNRLYRVAGADGGAYALKTYFTDEADSRDRIGAECQGLRFIRAHGLRQVPRALGLDRRAGCALFDWIEGRPVDAVRADDIDEALAFLDALKRIAATPDAAALPLAAEACLSGAELCRQIDTRYRRLAEIDEVSLTTFLDNSLRPARSHLEAAARDASVRAGIAFDADVPAARRTLSPSDFGFHNALRGPSGRLVFLDFEYFGWDDPVKLVADFLLHPGMALSDPLKQRFRHGAIEIFAADPAFARRLVAFEPLYAIRWCLILLNAYLPERWRRQRYAQDDRDRSAVQAVQLGKAQALLARTIDVREDDGHEI